MSGGSVEQEAASDEQCPGCGLWYDRRGISEHRARCGGLEEQSDEQTNPSVFDPEGERDPEPTVSNPTCPDCESAGHVITTGQAFERMQGTEWATEENEKLLNKHEHVCTECGMAFGGDDDE